jgi:hypothetical protein
MTKQTHKPNEEQRREAIDKAIEESVKPSPDSPNTIAELLDEHHTLVRRRFWRKGYVYIGGRYVRQRTEDE